MVLEITSLGQFQAEIAGPGLVVVDFFTTWCGPCKAIAPFVEQLQSKYPEVKFIKVDTEANDDIAGPLRISSIPTFHFYVKGALVDEMKGADSNALEQKVITHKVQTNPFAGQGQRLVAADSGAPALSAREARLKAFSNIESSRKQPEPSNTDRATIAKSNDEDVDEDEALAKALAISIADTGSSAQPAAKAVSSSSSSALGAGEDAEYAAMEAEQDALDHQAAIKAMVSANDDWDGEEMVPVPVNEELLTQLTDMGFPDVRARKSIVHGTTLDGALAWLGDHQDDADIDQPYMVKKSDAVPKAPLTEEEKARRVAMIKDKVKQRREDRAKEAKAEEIRREKERRERGQQIEQTMEERQRLQRKRENERIKKEKDDAHKERLRLRAEIARDKELRRLNKGVLPSVLGVEGYNPSIIQYDVPADAVGAGPRDAAAPPKAPAASAPSAVKATPASSAAPSPAPVVKKAKTASSSATSGADSMTPAQKVDAAISTISRYRTGGDGGAALKLLLTFVKNIVDHPAEPKYRSINCESAAFKSRLGHLVGPMQLLRAVGFEKSAEDGKLKFSEDVSSDSLIVSTATKLAQAEALYRQQNP